MQTRTKAKTDGAKAAKEIENFFKSKPDPDLKAEMQFSIDQQFESLKLAQADLNDYEVRKDMVRN